MSMETKVNAKEKFENAVKTIIEIIGEDPKREGLIKTPERVFKAFEFMTKGYKADPKKVLNESLFEVYLLLFHLVNNLLNLKIFPPYLILQKVYMLNLLSPKGLIYHF